VALETTAAVLALPQGAGLLLLADSRLPAGGHAHSGGVEAAVARGAVRDAASLAAFLRGRLTTAGLVAAGLAAAACALARTGAAAPAWAALDAEADARAPSPAQRASSRAQGRALLRVSHAAWPHPALGTLGDRPHHPVALGAAVAALHGGERDAALLAAQGAVTGPAAAAVRLCSFDPIEIAALLAGLAGTVAEVAGEAARRAATGDLPAAGAHLLDLDAEAHRRAEVRLFAS
jgi:urease accessory protein